MGTKNLTESVIFKASPHDVYETLMDSKKHSEFTSDKAEISREVGGKFSAYGGWIEGENLELVPDKKIIQKWRGDDWPKGVYSKVIFLLEESRDGTKLVFTHEGIPEEFFEDIKKGWEDFYWKPMKKVLKNKQAGQNV